jgi:hypothetical protein
MLHDNVFRDLCKLICFHFIANYLNIFFCRCYCSNSEGKRVFGQALPHEKQDCGTDKLGYFMIISHAVVIN